ncbi:DUF3768 domain-containing protein [Primorskyibacter flagellatus]|uniref:Uncharacterized protein n=1 Tax=Primorskyibacter flagellatus TaxID=1387277 RepID=A0A1W2DVZ6_9RHOB|nr:DUF3768 domain-containing protein [Primorskyibacter flagellatus]SMD01487.1 hypothetical protein SAMN06295998_11863 [Primorskyibacter flagellatus]
MFMEAGDGFMAEAVKATGAFDTFAPENDPETARQTCLILSG